MSPPNLPHPSMRIEHAYLTAKFTNMRRTTAKPQHAAAYHFRQTQWPHAKTGESSRASTARTPPQYAVTGSALHSAKHAPLVHGPLRLEMKENFRLRLMGFCPVRGACCKRLCCSCKARAHASRCFNTLYFCYLSYFLAHRILSQQESAVANAKSITDSRRSACLP